MERRTLLALGLGLAGSALVPGMRWGSPDEVVADAERLEAAADADPVGMAPRARANLRDVELLLATSPPWWRTALHRAAALSALAAVYSWYGGAAVGDLLDAAALHAEAARDGPLRARALVNRVYPTVPADDVACPDAAAVYRRAVWATGSARAAGITRARCRGVLAGEHAARGDERGALMELEAADVDASSGPPGELTYAAARRLTVLRRLGRVGEADREAAAALLGSPYQTTFVLCDLARLRAATGDLDAAAAHLEEAYLLARDQRLTARVPRILAVRRDLPSDATPVRRLDDVLRRGA
jgi:hypothetical protein